MRSTRGWTAAILAGGFIACQSPWTVGPSLEVVPAVVDLGERDDVQLQTLDTTVRLVNPGSTRLTIDEVRVEGDAPRLILVAVGQRLKALSTLHVPDAHGSVGPAAGEHRAVGRKRGAEHPRFVTFERADLLQRLDLVDVSVRIVGAADEQRAIRREGKRAHGGSVAVEPLQQLFRLLEAECATWCEQSG